MRIRYVEIFYAVMTTGTVKAAAKALNITQPAATRLLQQAEASVGLTLFDRTKGRLVATHEARVLFPEVEEVYKNLASIKKTVANLAKGTDESLRIQCVPSLSVSVLPRAVTRIQKQFPNLSFTIKTRHSRQIEEAIALRECDLGITFETASNPAVKAEQLATGPITVVGRGLKDKIALSDLCKLRLIELEESDPIGRRFAMSIASHQLAVSTQCTVESYQTAIALAAQFVGVAIVDSFSAKTFAKAYDLKSSTLHPQVNFDVYALTPTLETRSEIRNACVTEIKNALNDCK